MPIPPFQGHYSSKTVASPPPPPPPPPSVTFDPVNKGTNILLTNSNLTAEVTGSAAQFEIARSLSGVSADGTYTVDFTINGSPASYGTQIGLVNTSAALSAAIDNSVNGVALNFDGSIGGGPGGGGPSAAGYTNGDTIRMKLVIAGASRTIQWNNLTSGSGYLPASPAIAPASGALYFATDPRFPTIQTTVSNIAWT